MINFNLDSCLPFPFVGLFGCNLPEPASGLYVNDLEGINIIRVSQLTDSENPNIKTKFKSIYRKTSSEFFQDIITGLDYDNLEFNSSSDGLSFLGEYGTTSDDCEEYDEIGFLVSKNYCDPLAILNVSDISFITCESFDFTVEIREKGIVTKSIQVKTNAGLVNKVRIDYSTFADEFELVLNICGQSIYNRSSCGSTANSCIDYECKCFKVQPIHKLVGEEIFSNSLFNGIKISGACICDPVTLICKYANQLAVPFRYKLGIAIIEDALNSDNITPLTTANKEYNIQLLKSWMGMRDPVSGVYMAGKYPQSLKNVLKFISKAGKKINSDCIVCTGLRYQPEVY